MMNGNLSDLPWVDSANEASEKMTAKLKIDSAANIFCFPWKSELPFQSLKFECQNADHTWVLSILFNEWLY